MISLSQRVSIALVYTSFELTCCTVIIKIKNSICACSIVSRVFIYASNKPLCGTLVINLGKNSICVCSIFSKIFIYTSIEPLRGTLIINLGKTQFLHATANK